MFLIPKADLTAQRRKAQAKKKAKNEDEEDEANASFFGVYTEDDEFYKKWSGPVLIGGIFPAILSTLIIVAGELIINGETGSCGYNLSAFISAQIAVCYLFLLVFTWVYLGDDIYLKIPSLGINQRVLKPFRSMKWIIGIYLALGGMNFLISIIGTVLVQLSSFCVSTAPKVYQFSLFLVCMFWILFFIAGLYSVKLFFGTTLVKLIKEQTREETLEEVEERIFKKQFQQFDPELKQLISREDFPKLLQVLGIFVPEEEVNQLIDTLDSENTGFLPYDAVYSWFKEITKEDDQTNKKIDNVSDDESGEEDDK
eukprot:gene1916-2050_t